MKQAKFLLILILCLAVAPVCGALGEEEAASPAQALIERAVEGIEKVTLG